MLDRPLLLVTGKGGVGRSAVTAAVAMARARSGARVLALAVDRGAGLADHLGIEQLDSAPTAAPFGGSAALVDPASAMEEYVRRRVESTTVAAAARVFRAIATTVPGVRDIVIAGKLVFEATRGQWECVVVDAPAAGQIDSLFQAPDAIADLVPRGSVHQHAREVGMLFADPRVTELVTVATPEELAISEADETDIAADRAGLSPVRTRVANRLLTEPGFTDPPSPSGPMREAAELHLAILEAQRRLLGAIDPDARLPLLLGSHAPTEVAARLAEHLEPA